MKPVLDFDALPNDAFLTRNQVAGIVGFSVPCLKVWPAQGRGPRVTHLEGRPRYRVGDIREWIAASRSPSSPA